MPNIAVELAYHTARQHWVGCDWACDFGPLELPLRGMKAKQAWLLHNATAGDESEQWGEAAKWLEGVERDAQSAEIAARLAFEAASRAQWVIARQQAEKACCLEARYRPVKVWEPLRAMIDEVARLTC